MKHLSGGITTARGFKASGIHCGIKKSKNDLALIVSEPMAIAAGVFTTNKMKAAPVFLSMENIKSGKVRGIIANSGNANACTGAKGLRDAKEMIRITAKGLGTSPRNILVASTGEIGKPLPMERIKKGIPLLIKGLSEDGGKKAAEAILTTDTVIKETAIEYTCDKKIRIGGIAKGAGMIFPHMATMLCFIATDASIKRGLLQRALKSSVDKSFNSISIDGDTSTNDTVILLANGLAKNRVIDKPDKGFKLFQQALDAVCLNLAKRIVMDGEGTTKLIEIRVTGAKSVRNAKKVAFSIANSSLVKASFFGESFNWGRILAAAGYAGVDMDFNSLSLFFGPFKILDKGRVLMDKKDPEIKGILKKSELELLLDLGQGNKEGMVWTTDLSEEYVRFNADFMT